jgi:ABC-2 type transport system permease protein
MIADRSVALIRHNFAVMAAEPGPIVSRIVMPLVLITLTRPLYAAAFGSAAGSAQAVSGMLVMFSLMAMSVVGLSILTERLWHTADRLRAAPISPLEMFAGKATPILAVLVTQQIVVLAYGRVAFGLRYTSPVLLGGTVLIWGVMLLAVGTAVGTMARSGGALSAMVDIGSLSITGLGGAFVPLALLPGWARALAPASPGYWAMRAMNGALTGAAGPTLQAWLVIAAVAVLATLIAGIRLRHGWGRQAV